MSRHDDALTIVLLEIVELGQLDRIERLITDLWRCTMAELDDLNTNITALQGAVDALSAKVDAIPAPAPAGIDPKAVEAAASAVATATQSITDITAKIP